MRQLNVIGWVSSELIERTSASQSPYPGFSLAERVGDGANVRTQFCQVWAWGDLARHLKKGGVKKGSLIWVSGLMELEEYTKKDSITRDKRLTLTLKDWRFIPGTRKPGTAPAKQRAHPQCPHQTPPPSAPSTESGNLCRDKVSAQP